MRTLFLLLFLMPATLAVSAQESAYPLPTVPDTLTTPQQRADYVVLHYWEPFNFADTTLLRPQGLAEQVLVDFLAIMKHASAPGRAEGMERLVAHAAQQTPMLHFLDEMGKKYLYNPESPVADDSLYVLMLQHLSQAESADMATRERARAALAQAMQNRPGHEAQDFAFVLPGGEESRLYELPADRPTLLLFFDPDCKSCRDVLFRLRHSQVVNAMAADGRLTVLAVYPDDDDEAWQRALAELPQHWTAARTLPDGSIHTRYDLRQLPQLFLVDGGRRVVLRQPDIYQLNRALSNP